MTHSIGTPVIYRGEIATITRNHHNGLYDLETIPPEMEADPELPASLGKQPGRTISCVYDNEFTALTQRDKFVESAKRIRKLVEDRRTAALKTLKEIRGIALSRGWIEDAQVINNQINELGGV